MGKQNLNRVRDSLPNGYCARPPAGMPSPQRCLTCPDFQTTPEFLEVHRRQAATNRRLSLRPTPRASSAWLRTYARSRPTWAHHPCPGDDHRPGGPGGSRLTAWQKPTPEGTGRPWLRPKAPSSSSAEREQLSISVLSPVLQASPGPGSTRPTSGKASAACAPQRPQHGRLPPRSERA